MLDIRPNALDHAAMLDRIAEVEQRVRKLEAECKRLRAAHGARGVGAPMDLGHTYYPPGDPIPSRGGPWEHVVGLIFTHMVDNVMVVTKFQKNTSGRKLAPGQDIEGFTVDTRLTHEVDLNDYFYVEL